MTFAMLLLAQNDLLQVSLPVSTQEKSHQAAVVFEDEPSISKIVLGVDRDAISIDVVGNRLFLKLLKPAEGHLDCVGASARLYRIHVRVAREAPTEVLRVRGPKPVERAVPRPIALVRMMRTGLLEEGVRRLRLDGVVYESRELVARGRMLYRWEGYSGFVLELENRAATELAVDLSKFRGEGLVLAASRSLAIPAGGRTLLYLVFGKAP